MPMPPATRRNFPPATATLTLKAIASYGSLRIRREIAKRKADATKRVSNGNGRMRSVSKPVPMRPTRASEPLRGALVEWAERLGLFIAWAATIAIFGVITPETFFTWANFSTILGSQAVLVVL